MIKMLDESAFKMILETNSWIGGEINGHNLLDYFFTFKHRVDESELIKFFNIIETHGFSEMGIVEDFDFLLFLSKTQFITHPNIFEKLFNFAILKKKISLIDYLVFIQQTTNISIENLPSFFDLHAIIQPDYVDVFEYILKKNLPFVFLETIKFKILHLVVTNDDVKFFNLLLNYKIINFELLLSQHQLIFKVVRENIFNAIWSKIEDLTLVKKTNLFQLILHNPSETIFNLVLNNILSYKSKRNKSDIINNRMLCLMRSGFYLSANACYHLHGSLIDEKTIQLCTTLIEISTCPEIEIITNRQFRGRIIAKVLSARYEYPKLNESVNRLKIKLKLLRNKYSSSLSTNVIENCVMCYF